jgi:chemotaxis signal transduction protein
MQNNEDFAMSPGRVLIFPAQVPKVSGREVNFLFSLRQMEDILMDAAVRPVPFSPPYVEGIAQWRKRALPVVSLEKCLGMESLDASKHQRLMVVRGPNNDPAAAGANRIMLRVKPPIRMLTLPIDCSPVAGDWRISEPNLTRGVYEWQNGFLVIAHLEHILQGKD